MYKINYPYFGRINSGGVVAIINPNYAITSEHAGTYGFGFATYISRKKIIELFRYSKEISKQEFQQIVNLNFYNFITSIPGQRIGRLNISGLIGTETE
jgi:hypothetical protein